MFLVVVGLLLIALKLGEVGFVASLSWWWILSPFGLAIVWWEIADATGLTRRRAEAQMAKEAEKRRARRQAMLERKQP